MSTKQNNFFTYLIIIFLLAVSGTPCFVADGPTLLMLFLVIFPIYLKQKRDNQQNYHPLFLLSSFIIVLLLRSIYGKMFHISQFMLFIDVFFIAHIVNKNFVKCYNNILISLATLSLILWLGIQLSSSFYDSLLNFAQMLPQFRNDDIYRQNSSNPSFSLYFYTVPLREESIIRNSGLFYEPGMYAVYLLLSLTIMLLGQNKKIHTFSVLVLILASITTFSTTAYVALSVLILVYTLISNKINKLIKLIILIAAPTILRYIWGLDFISQKIADNYENEENTQSRFYAMTYHWFLIKDTPLLGSLNENFDISPNGLSLVLVYWGIPFSCIYYFYLYRAVFVLTYRKVENKLLTFILPIISFIVILITLFSQSASVYPLFYVILFIGSINYLRIQQLNISR